MSFVSQQKQMRKGFGLVLRLNDTLYELTISFRVRKGIAKNPTALIFFYSILVSSKHLHYASTVSFFISNDTMLPLENKFVYEKMVFVCVCRE